MRKHTVKSLYKILGQALKNLPFEITFHGKVIAVVLPVPLPKEYEEKSLLGIPILTDPDMEDGMIEFRDRDGNILSRVSTNELVKALRGKK